MGVLYLDRKNLSLKLDGRSVAFYENGVRQGSAPLNLLERIIVRGNIQLETRLLGALSEKNIGLLVLSGRNSRQAAMLAAKSHGEAKRRLAQYRLCLDEAQKLRLSRLLILAKLKAQRRFLSECMTSRPDLRKSFFRSLNSMDGIIGRLLNVDARLDFDAIRGYEGSAAAAYFSSYAALFPPSLDFTGRRKRPPPDPVNACLSLGYTLLHYDAVRACHMTGMDVMLGFYHAPAFGRESLACDLMEPVRPQVDRWVWRLIRERRLRQEHFSHEKGRCLLKKSGRKVFFSAYEGEAGKTRRLLRRYGYALAAHLQQNGSELA